MVVEESKHGLVKYSLLIVAFVAGLAAFALNIDNILSTSNKWLGFPTPAKERVAQVDSSRAEKSIERDSQIANDERRSFLFRYDQLKKLTFSSDRDRSLSLIINESLNAGLPDVAFMCAKDLQFSTDRDKAYWSIFQRSLELNMLELCGEVADSFQFSTDRDTARTMIIIKGAKR